MVIVDFHGEQRYLCEHNQNFRSSAQLLNIREITPLLI